MNDTVLSRYICLTRFELLLLHSIVASGEKDCGATIYVFKLMVELLARDTRSGMEITAEQVTLPIW